VRRRLSRRPSHSSEPRTPQCWGVPETIRASTSSTAPGVYSESCDRCHGANGDGVSGVDLRSVKFRRATTDGELRNVITNGFPTLGMPAFTLDAADLTGVVAYLRNMNSIDRGTLKPGDPAHGKIVVETKGACLSCHRINNTGSRNAPDLSNIGANRSAGSLERSLIDPGTQMWPINRPVHIVTKDGRVINGRRLNEDTYTVQMADEEGRLMSLNKSDWRANLGAQMLNNPITYAVNGRQYVAAMGGLTLFVFALPN